MAFWLLVLVEPLARLALIAVAIGIVTGSPTAAAVSAGGLVLGVYVWRNHVVPGMPPRDCRVRRGGR